MVYNSFHFIVFFPLIFVLYYVIPAKFHQLRNLFLLLVSYALYINWNPAFAFILLGVSLVTYIGGRLLTFSTNCADSFVKRRKLLVWLFSLLGLLPLFVFKYYNFINESIAAGLSCLGLAFSLPGLNWAVPIGISFFTFQAIGYLLDVYYGRIKAEYSLVNYLLFLSFFPSIVAGPINKASLMLPQIRERRPYFDYNKGVLGLKLLLWGMFMKVVVADRVGLYVDTVYAVYQNYSGLTCFISSLLYSVQIYSDFAGYSMMALGVGKVLGFELTENFRRPYFAISITDFWHRWHISLSTWLRDYVYIPIGGSRCSKLRNYCNVLITFLVSGIWHGANWTFIFWGCMHGMLQIVEKVLGIQKMNHNSGFVKLGRILVTFLGVNFAWIIFRMPTINDGLNVIIKIITFDGGINPLFVGPRDFFFISLGVILLFAKDLKEEFWTTSFKLMDSRVGFIRWCTYLFLIGAILLMGVFDAGQFIYANF